MIVLGDVRRTRAWRRLRDQIVREEPVCQLGLPGCTGASTTADHIIPVRERPDLALSRANCRGSCDHCNKSRQDRPDAPRHSPALSVFD